MWRLIFYWGEADPDMSAVNVSNKHIHFIYCIFIGQRSSTQHFLIVVKKKLRWEEEVSNTIKSRLFSRRVIWLMLTWLLYSIDNCQALSQGVLLPKLRTQFERITNPRYWKCRWKIFFKIEKRERRNWERKKRIERNNQDGMNKRKSVAWLTDLFIVT